MHLKKLRKWSMEEEEGPSNRYMYSFIINLFCLISTVSSGGADLKVKLVPNSLKNCDTLHLSGETKRLLIGAEKLKIKKPRISGISAEFCLQMSEEFQGFANGGEGFLTLSECERIIFMALQHIKPHEDGTVPGYSDVKLHKGRAISKFIYKTSPTAAFYFKLRLHNHEFQCESLLRICQSVI